MKTILIILCIGFLSPMFAQTTKAKLTGQRQEPANHKAAKGYPPHGYPCLCCVPCPGNPTEFCDIDNKKSASSTLKPHPDAFEIGYVYNEGKMIPLSNIVKISEVSSKIKELGGDTRATRVKCGCGTDIYGKDDAACGRICDFLKDYGKL
jgi:hypothetical protein